MTDEIDLYKYEKELWNNGIIFLLYKQDGW